MLIDQARQKIAKGETIRIAVIGGGAGAREFAIRLLEAGGNEIPLEIVFFEPRPQFGRGIAWSTEPTKVLANMRVHTLGPSYPQFTLIEDLLKEMKHPEAGSEYPSRNAVGDALDERWRRVAAKFPANWRYQRQPKAVNDIEHTGSTATIICDDGERHADFDIVVLALGNLRAARPSALVGNPKVINGWDVSEYDRIERDADVLIQGASLTSIDATLRLLTQGHKRGTRSIVWHSRGGHLPYVRPKQLSLHPAFVEYPNLENEIRTLAASGGALTLDNIFALFKREMKAQALKDSVNFVQATDLAGFMGMCKQFDAPARALDALNHGIAGATGYSLWFSVAKLFDEFIIPFLWNATDNDEKVRFLLEWRRDFDRYWAPIPVDNARRLQEWLNDDVIQLVKTQVRYVPDPATGKILFDPALEDPLSTKTKSELQARYTNGFDYLIEAGGIPADLHKIDSVLVKNLLQRKYLTPYVITRSDGQYPQSQGAKIDWYTGAVLDDKDAPLGWMFTLTGSLTTGAHRFTNSYLAVSLSADRLAKSLIQN